MGASLFMQQRIGLDPSSSQYIGSVWDALVYGFGSGIGWLFAIVLMGAIRERWNILMFPSHYKDLELLLSP